MAEPSTLPLPKTPIAVAVTAWLRAVLEGGARPSALELVADLNAAHGATAPIYLPEAIADLITTSEAPWNRLDRDYLAALRDDEGLTDAIRGDVSPDRDFESTVDALMRESAAYRSTAAFREMVGFMGRFRRYSPYNNMLVRVQNPSCGFYATKKTWLEKFGCSPKLDARPLLILAPRHPVMLVYALDEIQDPPLPEKLREFARFRGAFEPDRLQQLIESAAAHRIRVDFRSLSSTHGGFATLHHGSADWKMRIAVHDGLDPPSRFGVLCHELAHVLLGHVGGDRDGWWPARSGLDHRTVEIEAEAVAHIVAERFGLAGSSAPYLSAYTTDGTVPSTVSIDYIAKVAGNIMDMANRMVRPRTPRPRQPSS